MIQTQQGVYLFYPAVFVFQLFHSLDIRRHHTAIPRFPVIAADLRNVVFATDILHMSITFNFFQNPQDLRFCEMSFLHDEPPVVMFEPETSVSGKTKFMEDYRQIIW